MNLRKQAGITLSGFLMWAAIFVIGAMLGFKLGPAYVENATIKKHLNTVAREVPSGNRKDVEAAFSNRAQIDRIEVIAPRDIIIDKDGSGVHLSAQYTTRVPLAGNLSACMDFNPSSQ